jgi:hypothetical protein
MRRLGGPIGVWRLAVLVLATGFWAHQFTLQDLADFGWQFRYLSIWALTIGVISSAAALLSSTDPDAGAADTVVLLAAALAATQAICYWVLRSDERVGMATAGIVDASIRSLFLHVALPILLWIEAIFLTRATRGALGAAAWLVVVLACYMLWIEAAVAPLNPSPAGAMRTGLPYPFLNDMTPDVRAALYVVAVAVGLSMLGAVRLAAGLAAASYRTSSDRSAANPSR